MLGFNKKSVRWQLLSVFVQMYEPKHSPKRCSKPPRPKQRTNWWKPTFLCDRGPWETDERRMEGDRELQDSLTAEVVCGNLRKERWDQLSKQGGFGTTGDGSACPYSLARSLALPFPSPSAAVFFLSRLANNEEGREQTEGGRKFLERRRRSRTNCKILCYFNQP